MLNLAAEPGNVSRACKVMGFSRDTFYRYQAAIAVGDVEALLDANRRKLNVKNRVSETRIWSLLNSKVLELLSPLTKLKRKEIEENITYFFPTQMKSELVTHLVHRIVQVLYLC